jgi:beta-lactamase regulating signal transducer with metallopeptidase domain
VETLLHIGLSNALLATALALPAALVSRFCQRPALAHGLWLLVLLKLFTPPLFSVPVLRLSPSTPPTTSAAAIPVRSAAREDTGRAGIWSPAVAGTAGQGVSAVPTAHAASPVPPVVTAPPVPVWPELPWPWAIGLCWGAGSAVWLASVSWRLCRFQRLLRGARQAPFGVRERTRSLAQRFGLACCPDVWFVPGRVSPMLWSWAGPPRLLLPDGLWSQLPHGQQDTLLAHELAHLCRRDHWVRWLELAALALYWWHPLVWWAQRELEESEEQCCDAWVVAVLPAAAAVYAEALLQTVAYLSQARAPVAVGASGAGRFHHVQRRLIMILDGTAPKAMSPAGRWAVLLVAAVLLPLWPTWAHSQVSLPSDSPRGAAVLANSTPANVAVDPTEEDGRAKQIDQARAAVRDLTSQLDRLQARVEDLSARLHEAKARLARLEGRNEPLPEVAAPGGRRVGPTPPPVTRPYPLANPAGPIRAPAALQPRLNGLVTPPPAVTPALAGPSGGIANSVPPEAAPPLSVSPARDHQQGWRRADLPGVSAGRSPRRGEGDYEQRLRELELKLDRLLEQLKTLRERQPSSEGGLRQY